MKIASVTAALYLAFVVARLTVFGWDPSAFVVAGDGITDVAEAPPHLGVHLGTNGYDGQAYYRLARAPLTLEVEDDGITWTRPAYWQARIGYPLVVWAVSLGGQEPLVPVALLLVNLGSVTAVAALGAALCRDLGRDPRWALVPALWAGFLVGVGQDLTEPLAGALVLASVLALRRQRWVLAACALTAGALTRETALLLAVAVGAVAVLPWLRRRVGGAAGAPLPWWVAAVPAVVYLLWRTWVRHRWSDLVPHSDDELPLGLPLADLGRYVGHAATDLGGSWENLVLLVPASVAIGLVASVLADPGAGLPHERFALASYAGLLACLVVWDRGQAYLRWCDEPVLLGWTCLLAAPALRLRLRMLAGTVAVLWVATALATLGYPGTDRWQAPSADVAVVVR